MPTAVFLWVWFCAYLTCAGWTLSALHQLNAGGYAVTLLIGLAGWWLWQKKTAASLLPRVCWGKLRRRFRRPLPLVYLILALLAFLGGVLYAPNNYDALTYRLPRMLNWLAAGQWFWIPTINDRMNYATTGWEWVAMPLLALLRSDRALFLINAFGFLLMPGLLFSVFRQVGVARKVAWVWMWILPAAYGYATQAGSVGNDLFGAVFLLISVHYGLRARRSERVGDVWLAGLSAALMTAAKLSNLPLLLPCLIAVWPALAQLRRRWFRSVMVVGVGVLISAAPTVILNQTNTGCWNGDPQNRAQIQVESLRAAFLGNNLKLWQQSLMPPVLPGARKMDDWLNQHLPLSWRNLLAEKFPRYYLGYLNELPQEEGAGLGLGVTLLLLLPVGVAVFRSGGSGLKRSLVPSVSLVGLAAWVAALFYMLKMGSEATARLMLPYYPLIVIPILLPPAQNHLLRFRSWRILLVLAALSVLPAVILSPARPLWPAQFISERLARQHPDSPLLRRLALVYSAYARRNDALAPLRDGLPDNARTIGFVADTDDSDYSLWRPFGLRKVEYLRDHNHPTVNVPSNVEWIVVKRRIWPEASNVSLRNGRRNIRRRLCCRFRS